MRLKKWLSLVLFVGGVIGIGVLIGMTTPPGDWYAALQKPPLTPPNWLFPPVWTVLYLLIAIAGWQVWQQQGLSSLFSIWLLQMGLNFAWSPTVFAAHQLGIGLAIMMLLLTCLVLFIQRAWRSERLSALFFAPYALWGAFATYLNAMLYVINR
ncbi:TspO/MBR family protein [Roseibium sediminis]|uniref:TspO/MBR family protein n=1 Tax=Roseibium sediminis TaxID=1775174 RepID=UPI00123CB252|nr:TspO/MBR family protein [Roseibium sediminis]